jgi:hypothetical protein
LSRAVYSTNFTRFSSFTGGPALVYVVPTGYRAVVKCITIVFGDITISGFDGWVMDGGLVKLARYTWFTTLSSPTNNGGTALFFGDWVLNPADEIHLQTVAGTGDFSVAGYLLALP